jgi:hypothetical protein
MKFRFAGCAAAVLLTGPVLAQTLPPQTKTPTVPTGKQRQVGFFYQLNPDCSSAGDIDSRLTKEPKNGKAELEQGLGFPFFTPDSPFAKCNGKQVQGVKVLYQSNEGFTGKDAFDVEFIGPLGGNYVWKYTVTVK